MEMDKFGNVRFGETTKLLVSIIGRDAIISCLHDKKLDHKIVAFTDMLKRIYNEEKVEFSSLATNKEDNPQYYFKLFFHELEDNYNVPKFILNLVDDTIWQLFHACLSNTPYEKNKTDTVKYLFRRQIFHLLYELTSQNSSVSQKIRKETWVTFLSKIYDKPDTYKIIFKEAAKNITDGNLSLLLRNINDFALKQELSQNLNLQKISRWDEGTKATWKSIKPILGFFCQEGKSFLAYQLLAVYFLKNAKNIFNKLNLLQIDEFNKIIIDIITMLIENREPEEFYDTAFGKEDSIEYHFLMDCCLSSVRQPNGDTKELFDKLEQKCPKSKKFFSPWLKAKVVLYSNGKNTDYKEIRDYYRNAFDKGKYYAGCFMWQFILEAITLENCHGREGNLNDYYAFGYALEMFTGDKKILLETLNGIKHFELLKQYELIEKFCACLWSGPLLNIPYNVPNTELLFKNFLERIEQSNNLKITSTL